MWQSDQRSRRRVSYALTVKVTSKGTFRTCAPSCRQTPCNLAGKSTPNQKLVVK